MSTLASQIFGSSQSGVSPRGETPLSPAPTNQNGGYVVFGSSHYSGAHTGAEDGFIWWPYGGDTRQALDTMSDAEIRRRMHALWANVGFIRSLIINMSNYLGALTPNPVMPDDDANEEYFDYFQRVACNPEIFDIKGRFDYDMRQIMNNRARYRDGRILNVKTLSNGGQARLVTYEAHQIQNNPKAGDKWERGVFTNRFDRHLRYSLRDGKNPDKYQTVDAFRTLYYANWDLDGHVHGLSILQHAIANMVWIREVQGYWKDSIKRDSGMGQIIERNPQASVLGPAGGLGGALITKDVTLPDGSTQKINYEMILDGGSIPKLQPGEQLKTVQSSHPSQNNRDFESSLSEEVAAGTGLPANLLRSIASGTGPVVRQDLEKLRRWTLIEHKSQAHWCRDAYRFVIATGIDNGDLDPAPYPWHRQVQFIGMPDMTIDQGRVGAATVIELDAGIRTWGDIHAQRGALGRKMIKKRIDEFLEAKLYLGRRVLDIQAAEPELEFTAEFGELFPRHKPVTSASPKPIEDDEDEDEDDDEPDPNKPNPDEDDE